MKTDVQEPSPDYRNWVKQVWQVVRSIPAGHVLTYGEVARLAGPGGSARRVSQAMRLAPRELTLPWHRVVNVEGRISFPVDSHGYKQQLARLKKEGVKFSDGRIDLLRFGFAGALDALLWGEPGAGGGANPED